MSKDVIVKNKYTFDDFIQLYKKSSEKLGNIYNIAALVVCFLLAIALCACDARILIFMSLNKQKSTLFYLEACVIIISSLLVLIQPIVLRKLGFTMQLAITKAELAVLAYVYETISDIKRKIEQGHIVVEKENGQISYIQLKDMSLEQQFEILNPFYDFYSINSRFFKRVLRINRKSFLLNCLACNFGFLDAYYEHKLKIYEFG